MAALHLVGGHWGVMQMVAWAQMLRDYSQDRGMAEAVLNTFDGEHPCAMCLQIKAGRDREDNQRPASLPKTKAEQPGTWLMAATATLLPPTSSWKSTDAQSDFAAPRHLSPQHHAGPATPPPRARA